MELWVLGLLLFAVLLLAFLGFFKPQEGFQATLQTPTGTLAGFVTTVDQVFPGLSTQGYSLNTIQISGAEFRQHHNGVPSTTPVTKYGLMSNGTIVLGMSDSDYLKMVQLQFTITGNQLSVKLTGTKYGAVGQEVDAAWEKGTPFTILQSGTDKDGYGLQNLQVRLRNVNTINPANSLIRCPPNYKFFNSADGTSMCCRGTVNPYTHECMGTVLQMDLCTFSANEKDPRPAFKGQMIPECRDVTVAQVAAASQTCPPSLPFFAEKDAANQTCCKNPVELAGATGFKCSTDDAKDTTRYCIAKGKPVKNPVDGKMERMCEESTVVDTALCPKDATGKDVFQNVVYVMGEREATKYKTADLKGLALPTCYRLNESCIPESAIQYAQKRGAFTDYDPQTWEYSCAVWSKRNSGATVPGEVKGYLAPSS